MEFICERGTICKMDFISLVMQEGFLSLGSANVSFFNSSLMWLKFIDNPNDVKSNYIEMKFSKSTLHCSENETIDFDFMHNPTLKLVFLESELLFCKMKLQVSGIALHLDKGDLIQPVISIKVKTLAYLRIPSLISLTNTNFINLRSVSLIDQSMVILELSNPFVWIEKCIFRRVQFELSAAIDKFSQAFFSALVHETSFLDNHKKGKGGAISIISHVENSQVRFSSCRFVDNRVSELSDGMGGMGGALYVKGAALNLVIQHCRFENNIAIKSGMAMSITSNVISSIYNSSFEYTMQPRLKSLQFITATGLVNHFDGQFRIQNDRPELFYAGNLPLMEFEKVQTIAIKIKCPQWYRHISEYKVASALRKNASEVQTLKRFTYECTPCIQGRYSNATTKNTLFLSGENASHTNLRTTNGVCSECPYGATCYGNNVVSRPNYWGYWFENQLIFLRCPAHYCCTGSSNNPCMKYNGCAGNRTGNLCGECLEGYSISILSEDCVPDSKCGNRLLVALLAIFVSMAYAIWYTLKDDIFHIPSNCLKYVTKFKQSKIDNQTKQGKISSGLKTPEKNPQNKNTDKGYFGIVAYFVQMSAVMSVNIELKEVIKSESLFDKISGTINRFVGIDLTTLSHTVCPEIGLTTAKKYGYKLVFFLSIYLSWCILYIMVHSSQFFTKKEKILSKPIQVILSLKLKLIRGMVDMIKYTYAAFCGLVFTSLVCIQLGGKDVWLYDGRTKCFSIWQLAMIFFGIFYAIPFPIVLFVGMKLLNKRKISAFAFLVSCLCPVVLPLNFFCQSLLKLHKDTTTAYTGASETIISVLQGPYRNDPKHHTLYWEAVVSTRRLMITATLIGSGLMQIILVSVLCAIFLCHHIYFQPFQMATSNLVETFSLLFLCFGASINLLKACLIDFGVIPSGPAVTILQSLLSVEKSLTITLICIILIVELQARAKNRIRTRAEVIQVLEAPTETGATNRLEHSAIKSTVQANQP